jgi:FkbM family methyltransferase
MYARNSTGSLSNSAKRVVFASYLRFLAGVRSPLGKGFIGRLVSRLGFARYPFRGTVLELNPYAWIDQHLVRGRWHDPEVGECVLSGLAGGGIFLDVGANIGVFALAAAKLPGVIVYAFEPSPRELARLYRNLALNGLTNVVVLPFAAGSRAATVDLALAADSNPGMNSLLIAPTDGRTAVRCHCYPIDDLIPTGVAANVRVVKIDVEGYEMDALRGMSRSMESMRDVIFVVEVTRGLLDRAGSSVDELYDFFAARGFEASIGRQAGEQWNEIFVRRH